MARRLDAHLLAIPRGWRDMPLCQRPRHHRPPAGNIGSAVERSPPPRFIVDSIRLHFKVSPVADLDQRRRPQKMRRRCLLTHRRRVVVSGKVHLVQFRSQRDDQLIRPATIAEAGACGHSRVGAGGGAVAGSPFSSAGSGTLLLGFVRRADSGQVKSRLTSKSVQDLDKMLRTISFIALACLHLRQGERPVQPSCDAVSSQNSSVEEIRPWGR